VLDLGTDTAERVDYPEYAARVGHAVDSGEAERGVLVCGSGIGMCMGANRFPGVRAAVIQDEYDAEMSRQHNDANVACFGARKLDADRAGELMGVFLRSEFEGGRHEARVKKLGEISS
jgi:ribose 5-phosphate isomerase B